MYRSSSRGIFSSGGEGRETVVNGGVALYLYRGVLHLHFKTNGGSVVKQDVDASIQERGDQWLHVAGTWSRGGTVKIYIDGAQRDVARSSYASNPLSANYLIPKMQVGRLSIKNFYGQFTLDDWYFWDQELSRDQVKQVYNAYNTGMCIILVILVEPKSREISLV